VSDLHSINEAINKRAGRKLLPSIVVSLSLIALVWFALAYERVIFAAVVAVAVVLGVRELSKALAQRDIYISFRGLALATIGLSYATWVGAVAGLAIATAIAFPVLLISLLRRGPEKLVANATATTMALIYLPFMAGFLILLARPSTGLDPMVPKISPKKSWEGLAGSVIFTSIGGALAFHYILEMQWWIGIVAGLMIVFTATSGDLIESALKRDMSLKDMGNLLPGHGGMLDRLDSVLLSAPALWLALELVKRYL